MTDNIQGSSQGRLDAHAPWMRQALALMRPARASDQYADQIAFLVAYADAVVANAGRDYGAVKAARETTGVSSSRYEMWRREYKDSFLPAYNLVRNWAKGRAAAGIDAAATAAAATLQSARYELAMMTADAVQAYKGALQADVVTWVKDSDGTAHPQISPDHALRFQVARDILDRHEETLRPRPPSAVAVASAGIESETIHVTIEGLDD